jgi:hypothetical protein
MPNEPCRHSTSSIELERLQDATLDDGSDCFRVSGANRFDRDPQRQERMRQEFSRVTGRDMGTSVASPLTLWIETWTFLLRRIDRQTLRDGFRSSTTTSYRPWLNGAIGEDRLVFDPPA